MLELQIEFLAGGDAERGRGDPVLDFHWNTQVPFQWTERHVRQTEFWDVRQLDAAIEVLNDRYGVKFVVPIKNESAFSSRSDLAAPETPSRILVERDSLPSRESFDNEPTRALIRAAYSIDYETLGYA